MKLWFFSHYASPPDQPSSGLYYLAQSLSRRGHQVTIFSSSFNYYQRKELRLSGIQWYKHEAVDGVDFVWVRTTPHNNRLWTRAVNMVSFMLMVMIASFSVKQKPDYIIGSCPHLLSGLAALIVSKFKKAKFIFEVRDIWPETFVDHGNLSANSLVYKVLKKIELTLYKHSRQIITVLPFMSDYLVKEGVPKDKIIWVPNGVVIPPESQSVATAPSKNSQLQLMYLGGHAKYQGLDTVLRAAKQLQDEGRYDIEFVFVGNGAEKPAYQLLATELKITNVKFVDAIPRAQVQNKLAEADVLIFHLKKLGVLKYGMSPNKLCDYMIAKKPIICAVAAKNDPVREAGAGISILPEDTDALVAAIKEMALLPDVEREAMATRAYEYANNYFNVDVLAKNLEKKLLSIEK